MYIVVSHCGYSWSFVRMNEEEARKEYRNVDREYRDYKRAQRRAENLTAKMQWAEDSPSKEKTRKTGTKTRSRTRSGKVRISFKRGGKRKKLRVVSKGTTASCGLW